MGRGRSGRIFPGATIRTPIRDPRMYPGRGREEDRRTYHDFSDLPSGTHEYRGDGRRTVEFFQNNSNYDELISNMTYEQRRAFGSWMSGHFMYGQQWNGFDNMDSYDQGLTRAYDSVLDRARLDTGITLRRLATAELLLGKGNVTPTSLSQLQAMEGQVITARGNMSTAAAAQGLTIGARNKKVEYVMKIPGGSVGAGMWIGDDRIGGWGAQQREFMTNRDINFRVGRTTYNSRRGVYEVEMIYDGREEHDYGRRGR